MRPLPTVTRLKLRVDTVAMQACPGHLETRPLRRAQCRAVLTAAGGEDWPCPPHMCMHGGTATSSSSRRGAASAHLEHRLKRHALSLRPSTRLQLGQAPLRPHLPRMRGGVRTGCPHAGQGCRSSWTCRGLWPWSVRPGCACSAEHTTRPSPQANRGAPLPTSSEAMMKSLQFASGHKTVPTSRPSSTEPKSPACGEAWCRSL